MEPIPPKKNPIFSWEIGVLYYLNHCLVVAGGPHIRNPPHLLTACHRHLCLGTVGGYSLDHRAPAAPEAMEQMAPYLLAPQGFA